MQERCTLLTILGPLDYCQRITPPETMTLLALAGAWPHQGQHVRSCSNSQRSPDWQEKEQTGFALSSSCSRPCRREVATETHGGLPMGTTSTTPSAAKFLSPSRNSLTALLATQGKDHKNPVHALVCQVPLRPSDAMLVSRLGLWTDCPGWTSWGLLHPCCISWGSSKSVFHPSGFSCLEELS